MSETAVLDKHVQKRPMPKEAARSIFNADYVQHLLDEIQKNMDLPAVEMGNGVYQPLDASRRSPDYKRIDGTMAEGGIMPQRCCDLDKDGNMIPCSGAVVTDEFLEEFQKRVMTRLETIMIRTHAEMVRGGSQGKGRFLVNDRDRVMRFLPADDF